MKIILTVFIAVALMSGCVTNEARDSFSSFSKSTGGNSSQKSERYKAAKLTDKQSVADAQGMLKRLGFNVGVVDGIYGKKTGNAIKSFQRNRGYTIDGQVTIGLLDALSQATNSGGKKKTVAEAQEEDKKKGVAGGAILGALAGMLVADNKGGSKTKGAVLGAIAGAAAGGVLGNEMSKKRGNYAQKYNEIEAAIASTDKRIGNINSKISSIEKKKYNRNIEIQQLTQRRKMQKADIRNAKSLLAQLDFDIKENSALSTDTQIQLRLVNKDIVEVENFLKSAPNDTGLANARNELVQRRNTLVASLNTINGITPQLVAQRKTLNSLVSS